MADTFAQKNEQYWTKAAEDVHTQEWVHKLQTQIQNYLINNGDWIGATVTKDAAGKPTGKLMDYACGNGIVSRSLHKQFGQLVGVDLAEGMLAKYRGTANDLGLAESQMMTVQGNLLLQDQQPTKPALSREQLSNFDVVAICMALHHVDDIDLAIKKLAERLRTGGVLLVIDWAKRDAELASTGVAHSHEHHNHSHDHNHNGDKIHSYHPAAHTISHDSFTKETIFRLFEQAGCGDAKFALADTLSEVPGARSGKMQLFFARATKS